MPIHTQHLPISFEEWERLPRPPGWKYEYYEGCAHIRPNYQYALTAVTVAPRPVTPPRALRGVLPEDEAPLLGAYLEAFEDDVVYCDYTDEQLLDAARADLRASFGGRRAPLLPASRVAVSGQGAAEQLVGAALLGQDKEYGAVLDLLFIRPAWHRRGLATALAASAMNALHESGESSLTSCYHLANLPSQAWHRAFGFVERPDLRYAQAYCRFAQHELSRREDSGELAATESAALRTDLQYWQDQVEALERLAQVRGYEAVMPRLPHW